MKEQLIVSIHGVKGKKIYIIQSEDLQLMELLNMVYSW